MAVKLSGSNVSGKGEKWTNLTAQFNWNFSNEKIIERKGFGRKLNKATADIMRKYMDPYVPYLGGKLSRDVQTYGAKDHATISYRAPYASKQYYGIGYNHTLSPHPLATALWDKAAWINHKPQIVAEVDAERKRLSYGE